MRKLTLLACMALLAGCAGGPAHYSVIVDHRGIDYNVYAVDMRECRQYADQVSVGGNAAAGAIGGALMGAAFGAIFGDSDLAMQVAGAGALYGAADGVVAGAAGKSGVIKNCMRGRGYNVLN